MNCSNLTHDVLLDHAERRLDAAERDRVDQHLSQCPGCRERADEVKLIARGLRDVLSEPPPAALMTHVDQVVLGLVKPDRSLAWRRIRAIAAIAAALAVAFAFWGRDGKKEETNSQTVVQKPDVPERKESPAPEPEKSPAPEPQFAKEPTPEPKKVEPLPEPEPKPELVQAPPEPEPEIPEKAPDPVVPEPEPIFVKGDFNHNGGLDRDDLALLTKHLLAGRTYDPRISDVNGDGLFDCGDGLAILLALERNP